MNAASFLECKYSPPIKKHWFRTRLGFYRDFPDFLTWIVAILVILMLSGCAAFKGYPEPPIDKKAEIEKIKEQMDASAIKQCLSSPSISCRNQIVAAQMYAIDLRFSQFEESLFNETRSGNFGATLTTLGLTSAATVVTGGAAQIASGIATLVVGGRESFQKEVMAERTAIALHTAMRVKRAQLAKRLFKGMGQDIDQYPLALGLRDLNEYFNAGSVLGALVEITESVGAAADKAEKGANSTINFKLDEYAQKIRTAVCNGSDDCSSPNQAQIKLLKQCLADEPDIPKDVVLRDFVLTDIHADKRESVIKCMKL